MADYLFDGEETIATLVCGVDEAGRGPLAGPVVAAAVILNPDHPIEGLRDSKKLTAHAREVLAEQIKTHALAWAIAESSVPLQKNVQWGCTIFDSHTEMIYGIIKTAERSECPSAREISDFSGVHCNLKLII